MPTPKPTPETRPLAELKPHPLQDAFFDTLDDAALAALADDVRRNGLREPIEILPDGTIVSGHQRRRALERLGRTEARVLVCYDLAGDPVAAERRFLEANANHRQLGRLARDRVGAAIGMTGRNLSRYLRVLAGPIEVQRARRVG